MSLFEETTIVADDLTKIEGIGPAVAEVLKEAGISTFDELAATPAISIKEILFDAGAGHSFRDPATWAEQASLAAAGQWDKLETLQEQLQGGNIRLAADGPGEEE